MYLVAQRIWRLLNGIEAALICHFDCAQRPVFSLEEPRSLSAVETTKKGRPLERPL